MYKLINTKEFSKYMITKYKNHLNINIIRSISEWRKANADTILIVNKGSLIISIDDKLIKLKEGDIIELSASSKYRLFAHETSIVYEYQKGKYLINSYTH